MTKTIWWDMDGTLANLYAVPNWLTDLRAGNAAPYKQAPVMHNMAQLAKLMNNAQRGGCKLGIISWLAKSSTPEYDRLVTKAKLKWLRVHLKSVSFDEIHIVKYGTPKQNYARSPQDILFDDEEANRIAWTGLAFAPSEILSVMRGF